MGGSRTWYYQPKREMTFCNFMLSTGNVHFKLRATSGQHTSSTFQTVKDMANRWVAFRSRHGVGQYGDNGAFGGTTMAVANQVGPSGGPWAGYSDARLVAPSWGSDSKSGGLDWSGAKRFPNHQKTGYIGNDLGRNWGKPVKVWIKGSSRC